MPPPHLYVNCALGFGSRPWCRDLVTVQDVGTPLLATGRSLSDQKVFVFSSYIVSKLKPPPKRGLEVLHL